jgi:hypothetical protein
MAGALHDGSPIINNPKELGEMTEAEMKIEVSQQWLKRLHRGRHTFTASAAAAAAASRT